MTDKEKLVELIVEARQSMRGERGLDCELARNMYLAESLISNGVTVQDREIERLKAENNNLCLAINTLEEINRDLILRIESKKAHGWISVEEILPVPHHDVLVHYSNGKNEVGWSLPSLQHFTCECLHGKATHWMPLPPAPKGE